MRKFSCLMVVLFVIVLFSSISYAGEKEIVKQVDDVRTIKPDKFWEKCVTLVPRQLFEYKFDASSPVYFDIHYHGEHGRAYMIQKKKISSYEGTITEFQYRKAYKQFSKKAHLCMLWKNNSEAPVEISLGCTTSKR